MRRTSKLLLTMGAGLLATTVALAQGAAPQSPAAQSPAAAAARNPLGIPENTTLFATDPKTRKATAIVNGHVITQTDVDQRLALAAAGRPVPPEQLQALRYQVFANLIDETLQIQEAKANEITVSADEIDGQFNRVARQYRGDTTQFRQFLRELGASEASLKRQIEGELAWTRLQRRKIEAFVNVGDDEVQQVIGRLNAAKGTEEFKVSEIFLAANGNNDAEVRANAAKIVNAVKGGGSFVAYARQFSEASTAAVGGDLGWVRPEALPEPLAVALRRLPVGSMSEPIPVNGGYSILVVADKRQVLTADLRDTKLNLKQVGISFAPGTTREAAAPKIEALLKATRNMGGCGRAEAAAAPLGAEVVQSDELRVRDLPSVLQNRMLAMQVGEATEPFGSVEEGVRVLVLCGRDAPEVESGPSFERIQASMNADRVNRRARRYLRDLRRDAVIDYR